MPKALIEVGCKQTRVNLPMNPPHILLIDDDEDLVQMLQDYLSEQDMRVDTSHRGKDALAKIQATAYDLLILDIMMPEITGLELLPMIRAISSVPVIMLTGRGDDIDRIIGLEMGADDYLPKPCNPRELVARIKAILRRESLALERAGAPVPESSNPNQSSTTDTNERLSLHNITLDLGRHSANYQGQDLELTTVEFQLLAELMKQAGHPISKSELSQTVLERRLRPFDRTIDVHISRLRQKLKQHRSDMELIKTIRNKGYQLISE